MNSQNSLTDQLKELVTLANKNGLYDAADYINNKLEANKHFTDSNNFTKLKVFISES